MKNFIKSVLFVIIFLLIAVALSYGLAPKRGLKEYGLFNVSGYEFLSERKDSIDIVFAGDSLTYSGISPMDLWNYKGYTSYDLAYPAHQIEHLYKKLELIIEAQHPKVVFMEANVLMRDATKYKWYYDFSNYENMYLPLVNFHNNWKKILFKGLDDSTLYSWTDPYKGFKYVPDIKKAKDRDYMKHDDDDEKAFKIPNNNFDVLRKIYELCKKNNIKFILISTPNSRSWNYAKYLAARNSAQVLGVDYIELNLNNPLKIDWRKETKDEGSHLNYAGALKVTKFLGDYIEENNLAVDHRNDKDYEDWHEAYDMFVEMKQKMDIKEKADTDE